MPAKFQLGDKVRFSPRAPQYILEGKRRRTRVIIGSHYSPTLQATLYELCQRGKTPVGYLFRSYQFTLVNGREHERGKPPL